MKTVVYRDGTYKHVEHSWEHENDPDYLVTIDADAALLSRAEAAEKERDAYKKALEHYAWKHNWWKDGHGNYTEWQVHKHGYQIAREALAAYQALKEQTDG
jgi:hypothetical protein